MKMSLSVKLLVSLGFLIAAMTISIAYFNSKIITETILQRERDFNLSLIESKDSEISSYVESILSRSNSSAKNLLLKGSSESTVAKDFAELSYIEVYSNRRQVVDSAFGSNLSPDLKEAWAAQRTALLKTADLSIDSTPKIFSSPAGANRVIFIFPFSKFQNELDQIIFVEIEGTKLLRFVNSGRLGQMGIITSDGKSLLSLPDENQQEMAQLTNHFFNFSKNFPLKNFSGVQKANGRDFVVSFTKNPYGLIVFNAIATDVLLAPAKLMSLNTIELSGYFLTVSIFLLFLFSLNITSSLEKLAATTREIAKGNFDQDTSGFLKQWFKDEVYSLTLAVDKMVKGLRERDRFKTLFNKFHGSAVTDDLMKNDITLGGEKKNVFVFFSDLRGFTQMSESEDPEKVVQMLNEYFGRMVPAINESGGVVDKFIGDAIMAVWGVPHSSEDDGKNALTACLKIRTALAELNLLRIERGEAPLWMGMGLHYGEAISGTIGSEERMEYTVIGNTINTASRIESSTKSFGTDLLVSEEVQSRLPDFIYEEAGSVQVKGRSSPLKLFKVRGLITEGRNEIEILTKYSSYDPEAGDKVKVVA